MTDGVGGGEPIHADADLITLQPGQLVGRYRIVSVLGQGGFGITYRGIDAELDRQVAIKEYLPAALATRQDRVTVVPRSRSAAEDLAWGLDRFIAEGRTLAALHHAPGIVKVHDYLQVNGTAYLIMELVEGETLQRRIERNGPLEAAAVEGMLHPLLDGLEQVHAAGFLHRDIKPANILLDAGGRPTLIDFGASRAAVSGRSQAMTAVFTPGYAPVEQFTSAPQGAWTDIYSLAATLYHAITGTPPPNAVDRMLDDTYVALSTSGRRFRAALLAGVDSALAVRAGDRPQSVAAWRLILSGAAPSAATLAMPGSNPSMASSAAGTPMPSSARHEPVHGRRSHNSARSIAFGAALLLAAAGGWFVLGPGTKRPGSSAETAVVNLTRSQEDTQQQLELARREQRAAQEEATRLRTEAEARQKADDEAALRARIEKEVQEKAAAEETARRLAAEEAKRQADEQAAAAGAAKSKAEAEAAATARENTAQRLRAEENNRKTSGEVEASLRLATPDRQRIQVALNALGFSTGGADGMLGVRSREMIAAWQTKTGRAATGYLTRDQHSALLSDAAPALARYDEEQKKLAQAPSIAPPSGTSASPAVPVAPSVAQGTSQAQCEGGFRSQWCRVAYQGFPANCWYSTMTIRNGVVSDGWTSQDDSSKRNVVTGRVDANGSVSLTYDGIGQQTHINQRFTALMSGKVENGVLRAAGRAGSSGRDFNVTVACR